MDENKKIIINIDDTAYSTYSTPSFDKKIKWTKPGSRIVTAIIPGTIVDIFAKEGNQVKKGDNMLVIEAMKMNNQILFEVDGVVEKILVSKGDVVSKGQQLLILK